MGVQAQSGNNRLRTIWTPEMDRYFIGLMLEQAGKGNRMDDNLFSKQAWKHMASLFNAKYKFQYKKDILKNRHKTLRNLYKATRNLLDQEGFRWDETRQMVTADNRVWDDYIKVHPDARSYRIKSIPHFSDLCEIYKNTTVEGKRHIYSQTADIDSTVPASDTLGASPATPVNDGKPGDSLMESSSHSVGDTTVAVGPSSVGEASAEALQEIMVDEESRVTVSKVTVSTPQRTDDRGSMVVTRTRTYWQPPMDRYFIDLMLVYVQKGDQIDGLFHKQAWMEMTTSLNARFGFKYETDILKNRYKTLRRQYNLIKNLLELDGFMWDETRQMVTADDWVWQDYIKAHTDARQYMTRPVPYYKDLCVICRDLSGVDGRCSVSDHTFDQQDGVYEVKLNRELRGSQSPAASASSADLIGNDEQDSSHVGLKITVADQRSKRQFENQSSSAHSKKSRSKQEEGMASALREMATAVSSLADNRKDDNSISTAIENVIEAIQALPDMDEDLVLDACDFLEDEKKAKTFMALDVKLRKKWLIRKLRANQ